MKVIKLDEKIFDGPDETEFLKLDCLVTVENDEFRLKFDDFDDNSFDPLVGKLPPTELKMLVEKFNLKPYETDNQSTYTDERGLSLYYCYKNIKQSDSCLVIISFGERQPARYQIFVLGVAIMDQNSNIP